MAKTYWAFLIVLMMPLMAIAQFAEENVASGLFQPTSMTISPDGRIFVTEKSGSLRIIKNGVLLPTPFLSLTVVTDGERGLDGITLDPDFNLNGYVYIFYTNASGATIKNTVRRYTASSSNPDVAQSGSDVVIIDNLPSLNNVHNGGALVFGPDSKLYISTGDGFTRPSVQLLSELPGKMLRINSDGSIPSDNPYVGVAGARPEIYARGFRNPYSVAVDPVDGRFFVNDVGENSWEEINQLAAGANYGWPQCEADCSISGTSDPFFAYPHASLMPDAEIFGSCISGGEFYRGNHFPNQYVGNYFFSDLISGNIYRIDNSNQVSRFFHVESPLTLKVGPEGYLYYLSYSGYVRRIKYVGSANRDPHAIIQVNTASGIAPLTVNFNGTGSTDPDGNPLSYSWDFGDGSGTATGGIINHTYNNDGNLFATLTVNDGSNGIDSTTVNISVGNSAPIGQIQLPTGTQLYTAGDTINYAGTGTDLQDGALSAANFSWVIQFHHDTHFHPFQGPIVGTKSGSFTIPIVGELSPNVWYRTILTVKDSKGLADSKQVDIFPKVSTLNVTTNPSGLDIFVDEHPSTAPFTVQSVAGIQRSVGTTQTQNVSGQNYIFIGWSDGGALSHTFQVPSSDLTLTAHFQLEPTATPVPTSSPTPIGTVAATPSPTPTPLASPTVEATVATTPAPEPTSDVGITEVTPTQKPLPKPKKTALRGCKVSGKPVIVQLETSANRRGVVTNSGKSNWKVNSAVLGGFCTNERTSRIVLVSKSRFWNKEGRQISNFKIVSKYSSSTKPVFTKFPNL